jgi:hypothetical protein
LGKDEERGKQIDTIHGWVGYSRERYECRRCKQGYYPADEELELSKESRMSQKKEDQMAKLSVRMPYEEAVKTYEELTGLGASVSVVHRVVQEKGEKFGEAKIEHKPLKGDGKEHVGSDGTMVNIREEGWKEVKIGAYYKTDAEGEKEEVRYAATTASREEIGKQLYALAGRPNLEQTGQMGFIGDGAEWLEEIRQEHFVKSTRIVDFYHVSEYIGNLGKIFYGEKKGKEWIEEKLAQIKAGGVKDVQESLGRMKAKTDEQKEELEKTRRYLKNHKEHMKYDEYKRMGFHIGSGVIEAGCKHVIGHRFKRAGMRWSRKGAKHLMCLRVAYLNEDWERVQNSRWN